jgi:hypothetical protein
VRPFSDKDCPVPKCGYRTWPWLKNSDINKVSWSLLPRQGQLTKEYHQDTRKSGAFYRYNSMAVEAVDSMRCTQEQAKDEAQPSSL